jgi:hypothetical protein
VLLQSKLQVSLTGSGEGHSCYVYKKVPLSTITQLLSATSGRSSSSSSVTAAAAAARAAEAQELIQTARFPYSNRVPEQFQRGFRLCRGPAADYQQWVSSGSGSGSSSLHFFTLFLSLTYTITFFTSTTPTFPFPTRR